MPCGESELELSEGDDVGRELELGGSLAEEDEDDEEAGIEPTAALLLVDIGSSRAAGMEDPPFVLDGTTLLLLPIGMDSSLLVPVGTDLGMLFALDGMTSSFGDEEEATLLVVEEAFGMSFGEFSSFSNGCDLELTSREQLLVDESAESGVELESVWLVAACAEFNKSERSDEHDELYASSIFTSCGAELEALLSALEAPLKPSDFTSDTNELELLGEPTPALSSFTAKTFADEEDVRFVSAGDDPLWWEECAFSASFIAESSNEELDCSSPIGEHACADTTVSVSARGSNGAGLCVWVLC